MPRTEAGATSLVQDERHERSRPQLTERMVAWSTRYRLLALTSWLLLVILAAAFGGLLPGEDALGRDPGESGRAQDVLRAQKSYESPLENVLLQAREPGGEGFDRDPRLREAAQDLVATLRDTHGAVENLHSPLEDAAQISTDGRSGLVSFHVAGPVDQVTSRYNAGSRGRRGGQRPGIRTCGSRRPATGACPSRSTRPSRTTSSARSSSRCR